MHTNPTRRHLTSYILHHTSYILHLISYILYLISYIFPSFSFALTLPTATAPVALPPFTFVGRVTDASHAAFGNDAIAEVRVYSTDGTTLLAKSSTVDGEDSVCNFAVDVPVSSGALTGYVTPGTKVKIVFLDSDGNRYDSIVSSGDAVVGNPGKYKWIAACLGTDANGDGIADEYAELYLLYGQYLGYDLASFEASADYDGDGQSNLAEYIAGTDPYLAEDVFDTSAVTLDFWPNDATGTTLADWTRVTFPTVQGRCYSVYATPSLDDGSAWSLGTFSYEPSEEGLDKQFHVTGSEEGGTCSLYLPKETSRRFWRIVVE